MQYHAFVIKYAEIGIKGKNRYVFEDALCDRIADGRLKDGAVFFHFSERYEGDEVIFDYKLREGMSHESNARFLMRLVGIE